MSTTALAPVSKPSALALMASRVAVDPAKLHQTLKATVFKGATDEELLALVVVANTYNLNPLLKELYAFPAKGGGIVPVVSIDGWISMVNAHPQMDGLEFEDHRDAAGKLEAITCTIWRKDRSRPIKITEHLAECKRGTEPWKMENRMLRHKALIQCARVAFGFSGVTDEDEVDDLRDVTPRGPAPVKADPFAGRVAPVAIEAPAESAPPAIDRKAITDAIAAGIKASGRKNSEAFAIFTAAGLMTTAKMSDASDEELAAIAARLDLLEGAAEQAEPIPTPDAKDEWISRLEDLGLGLEPPMSIPQLEAAFRKAKVLSATETLKGCALKRLEGFHANFAAIIVKAGEEGA